MLPFLILVLARFIMAKNHTHYFLEAFFDFLALTLIWPLTSKLELKTAYYAYRFLKARKKFRKKVELISALVLDGFRVLAVFFLGSWLARWLRIDWFAGDSTFIPPYLTYLDAFFLCYALAQSATAHRWSWWIYKIPFNLGRQILVHYFAAILGGTFLLIMPFSINQGQNLSLLDSFFISVSALSVTGLTPINVNEVFSPVGLVVLLLMIQLGGLGIIVVTAALSLAAYQRLSLASIALGQTAFGGITSAGLLPKFLARVVSVTLILEAFGTGLLYLSIPHSTPDRFFVALFHSISAFCNAGFSLYPEGLHATPLKFPGVIIISILIMLGGLGFPILFELSEKGKTLFKSERLWERLSPYTRLTLTISLILWIGGFFLFFVFEEANPTAKLPWYEVLSNALFYSISARTAGFAWDNLEKFHLSVHFFLILLMMIGANPSSTGGGMKTTTVGVLFVTVYSTIFNKTQNLVFQRAIPLAVLKKALTVVIMYLSIAGLAITILSITEKLPTFHLIFEVVSALSTVGLSMGITPALSPAGKLVIIFLMLFGRVGILTLILAGVGDNEKSSIRYPEDDFFVG